MFAVFYFNKLAIEEKKSASSGFLKKSTNKVVYSFNPRAEISCIETPVNSAKSPLISLLISFKLSMTFCNRVAPISIPRLVASLSAFSLAASIFFCSAFVGSFDLWSNGTTFSADSIFFSNKLINSSFTSSFPMMASNVNKSSPFSSRISKVILLFLHVKKND
ncbi:hypothetical protein CUN30_00250 [Enterococcus faecalis]|nr:hypothetical protein [Enterococcus faecalis]EGO8861795.1 hypothetical protein [Enterococcus faecalis]EGO9061435.1 hypothetical protein [Enterococcus faecalis]MUO98166.1 hypothetical protein [Enterococcus faecalis]PQB50097.1 hypothetical protein CUN30_00250 [Enterococcus faecalis]